MATSSQNLPYMERDIYGRLVAWKDAPYRKPLILKGARQVGKTRALKEFGARQYEGVAYLSLEKLATGRPSPYAQFFEATNDPHRIVASLSLAIGQTIQPEKTLLILDEIQDCPSAVKSLKYFSEDAPEYHVACAGSLLGVALASQGSFPVGKVSFLDQYPMTFSEFLRATGAENLDAFCAGIDSLAPIPDLFADMLAERLQTYFAVGGMPEAVGRWAGSQDISDIQAVLGDLIDSYERDFSKHGGRGQYAKISLVWNSLPSQLARENKKFKYGIVRSGARAREYEDAITWLVDAGLIARVPRTNAPGLPVKSYDDGSAFKAYCLDVGVLRRLSALDPSAFGVQSNLFSEFKGAFAENYALQALRPQLDVMPRYWTNEKPPHEVDFVVQVGNAVVPVEVKSGEVVNSPSLRYYARKYPERTPLRVRLSLRNLSLDGGVLNIPLYLADQARRLIEMALAHGA